MLLIEIYVCWNFALHPFDVTEVAKELPDLVLGLRHRHWIIGLGLIELQDEEQVPEIGSQESPNRLDIKGLFHFCYGPKSSTIPDTVDAAVQEIGVQRQEVVLNDPQILVRRRV